MKKPYFLLIFGNLIASCFLLHAQVTNGSFSTDDFSGWTVLGNPTIDTSTPPAGATAGAVISSTNTLDTPDAVDYTTIQNTLGVILPSTNIGTEAPVNGEAIFQTITLTVPTQLTFEYQMTAQDTRILTTDEVGYSLTNVGSITSSDPYPGTFYALDDAEPLDVYSPVTTDTIAPGTYYLGLIAYNTADNHGLTSFEVSDVGEAPEPATWMLMVGGLVFLAGLCRSVRRIRPIRS
jgi:hypothetical protein